MAGAASACNRLGVAERRVIVQPGHMGDGQGVRVEHDLSSGYLFARLILFAVVPIVASVISVPVYAGFLPGGVEGEGVGVEFCAGGIATENIVRSGIVALRGKVERPASGSASVETTRPI